jgi:limonene-1,2-epoxide hydrolase/quercetin dioxygenase-like cupin family protein
VKVTPGVTRTPLLRGTSEDALRADRFRYPPGGHTHWHIHAGEQVLYGESGRGWVRFEGQERVPIEPAGVVHVPVGVRHWHGSRPDTALVHVAVTAGGGTEWLGEVTAAEYAGQLGPAAGSTGGTKPATEPDEVIRAFVAAIERQDIEGPDGIRGALSRLLGAAEQIEWVTRRQVSAGDAVMNERLDRFQLGDQWVEVPVAGLFVLRDGRIALWRDYFDLATYRRQTGPTSGH